MQLPRRMPLIALAVTLATAVASCSALGEDDPGPAPVPGGLEKPAIKVAVLQSIDASPIDFAVRGGYFQREGLTVTLEPVKSGPAATDLLKTGGVDVSFASYVPLIAAKAKNVIDVRIVADATALTETNSMVLAMPNSQVKDIRQLAGRRVAVIGKNTMAQLLVMAGLEQYGIDEKTVDWREIPIPDTAALMQKGDVDAAFAFEPWTTKIQKATGASPIFDTSNGATKEIPLTGYGAMADWVSKNPKTLAAFQRAMARVTNDVAPDPTKLKKSLVEFAKVDEETAAMAKPPTFTATLSPDRIQRVADLMQRHGVIKERFDVRPMIVPHAPSSVAVLACCVAVLAPDVAVLAAGPIASGQHGDATGQQGRDALPQPATRVVRIR